jgi:hypothetical protein
MTPETKRSIPAFAGMTSPRAAPAAEFASVVEPATIGFGRCLRGPLLVVE